MTDSYQQVGTFIYRISIRYGVWAVVGAWTLASILLSMFVTSILLLAIWHSVGWLDLVMSALITALVTPPISYVVARMQLQLNIAQEKLRKMVREDALTGAATRMHFSEQVLGLVSQESAHNMPACVLMIDIDNFKSINDLRGHAAGDAVLRVFAATLRRCLRERDVLGRYGGEEFSILLPSTDAIAGREIAERLRLATLNSAELQDVAGRVVTISVGMVSLDEGAELDVMLAAADRALYRAKNLGRDQVCETVTMHRPNFATS